MGLKQSGLLIAQMPLRHHGGYVSGERNLWGRHELRNTNAGQGITDTKAGIPSGYRHPGAWLLPMKPGALSSRNEITGSGTLAGAGARGVNGEASLTGTGDLAATGALIVSGIAELVGTGTISANIVAALAAAADLSGSGTLDAALLADGYMIAPIPGTGTLALTSYATGTMECDIVPPVILDAQTFSAELLATEIEPGLTLEGALRLIAAATAGKVSGGGTATVTIKNAVADDKSRIVAEVDSSGNRTAITYDLS
mgnify:CR=1 FL=1